MTAIVSAIRLSRIRSPDELEVHERRVVDLHPERLVGAVRDRVGPVEAARPLDPGPRPAGPRPEQSRQLRHDRPVGHVVQALVDDPQALLDLLDPQQVAVERVAAVGAVAPGRDVELELGVDRVRVRPADVERDAGRPQVRAGDRHPERELAVQPADVAHPADEDLVLVEQQGVRVVLLGRPAHPVAQAGHELVVDVAVDAADPEVVEQHPLAGDRGQHLADLVALDEAVQDRRQAAQVERHPAHEQGVARDPVELAGEHPDVLGAPRHLDVEQLLERHHRRPLAEQRAHVLERVDLADDLVVVGVLAQLLDAAVEVAEDGVEVDDALAADLEDHPQHAVRRGVLGAHVEEHLAVAERVELGLALGARRVRRDGLVVPGVVVEQDARVVLGGVLARRCGSGHRQALTVRRTTDGVAWAGTWPCSMCRTPPPGERAASSGR